MGLLDFLSADPSSAQAMQAQGLFGGLQALGAGLAQAGQMRPLGQPGPSLGDAFLAYGRGRQQGLLGASQQNKMDRQTKMAGLLAEIRSGKPMDQMTPDAQRLAPVVSALPPEVLQFADEDNLPGMMLQRGTQRQRPMTSEELAAGGFRPGSVVMVNDFTGNPNVVQQPDTLSPGAEAQRLRLALASRQPREAPVTWRDEHDADGNVIGQRSSLGQFHPAPPEKPLSPGQAMSEIVKLGSGVASGQYPPGSPQFNRYVGAYTVVTKDQIIAVPDTAAPGGTRLVQQPGMTVPDHFPNPTAFLSRTAPGAAGAPPPAEGAAPPQAQPAPAAAPQGVEIPGSVGMRAQPPPTPAPGASVTITPAHAKIINDAEVEFKKIDDAAKNYVEVLRKHGVGLGTFLNDPTSPKAQEVLGAYERVKMALRSEALLNTGALQAAEMTNLDNLIVSPQSIRGLMMKPDAVEAKLGQFTKSTLDLYNTRRKQAGLPPVQSLGRAQDGPGATSGATMRFNPATGKVEAIR